MSAIEPSLRLALVEAISDTAALVTADLDDVVAVVRLEGRDPVIAVERTDDPSARTTAPASPTMPIRNASEESDDDSARITVRLRGTRDSPRPRESCRIRRVRPCDERSVRLYRAVGS